MRDQQPPLLERVYRKLRIGVMWFRAREYLSKMDPHSPLKNLPLKVVGDAYADPTEFFDHYDAFAFWTFRKLQQSPVLKRKILDVGSPKMMCGMLSAMHDVTSIVLADCSDTLSRVHYVRHDVADKLPFEANSFDVFTSTVALPLVGLGRYRDRVDPNCLPNLIHELDRVMTDDADLLISMCLGPNVLTFNNGWFLDIETIARLFRGWAIVDLLVDRWSSTKSRPSGASERFSNVPDIDGMVLGDCRVVFLHFRRGAVGG